MKLKNILGALALTLLNSLALAAPVTLEQTIALKPGKAANTLTTPFTTVHTVAGEFIDTYYFTGLERWAQVNGSLTTIGSSAALDIDFITAIINGVSYSFTKTAGGVFEIGSLTNTLLTEPLTLVIHGYAGEGLAVGTAINASYSGTLNATQLPEPGSLALAGLGLAAFGLVRRQRKSRGA